MRPRDHCVIAVFAAPSWTATIRWIRTVARPAAPRIEASTRSPHLHSKEAMMRARIRVAGRHRSGRYDRGWLWRRRWAGHVVRRRRQGRGQAGADCDHGRRFAARTSRATCRWPSSSARSRRPVRRVDDGDDPHEREPQTVTLRARIGRSSTRSRVGRSRWPSSRLGPGPRLG